MSLSDDELKMMMRPLSVSPRD